MGWFRREKTRMVDADRALPGRADPLQVPCRHYVNGHRMKPPFSDHDEELVSLVVGMGCFWGAERRFWQTEGVYSTAVGYAGGYTPNPTYEEVCSGLTGHTEVVRVVFDPAETTLDDVLKLFWEGHVPTQGMRQGNDVGTQYRSAIYYTDDSQRATIEASRDAYQRALSSAGMGTITTEVAPLREFYYAEDYHQQYLAKVPNGYCGLGGTGISCPIGAARERLASVVDQLKQKTGQHK